MGSNYRRYIDGSSHHVYNKGIEGNIIFYSHWDCILYLTLYYLLGKQYGITTWAFCIMPNHVHSNVSAHSYEHFESFHRDLFSKFTLEYNNGHSREGGIFKRPYGYAPKTYAKRIRENISYICNNPVVGNISTDIDGYKWNLMALRATNNPFSEKIILRKASNPLRRSIVLLRYYHETGMPLTYVRQRRLFTGLDPNEIKQLTDRIISFYNCLDYTAIANIYGGDINNAIIAINANTGNEYDIPEDKEDYSAYYEMLKITSKSGIDLKTCNFEKWPQEKLTKMAHMFSKAGFHKAQIGKFLHLKREWWKVMHCLPTR